MTRAPTRLNHTTTVQIAPVLAQLCAPFGRRSQFLYKGTDTINGSGDYGFMLTAIDAGLTPNTDVDLVRIKIWDKDNGDAVVYDNLVACSDTADDASPCMVIGGGSIVIHKEVDGRNFTLGTVGRPGFPWSLTISRAFTLVHRSARP